MAGDICVCSTSFGEGRNKGITGPAGALHHYRFGEGDGTTLCGQRVGYHYDGTMADAVRDAKRAGLSVYPCKLCTDEVTERDSSST